MSKFILVSAGLVFSVVLSSGLVPSVHSHAAPNMATNPIIWADVPDPAVIHYTGYESIKNPHDTIFSRRETGYRKTSPQSSRVDTQSPKAMALLGASEVAYRKEY
jgi:hypothetical protein